MVQQADMANAAIEAAHLLQGKEQESSDTAKAEASLQVGASASGPGMVANFCDNGGQENDQCIARHEQPWQGAERQPQRLALTPEG